MANNHTMAFYDFLDWSEGRCFNEILGCAKIGIEGLFLLKDVDEFNGNEIACEVQYTNGGGDCTTIQVWFENGQLKMYDLMEKGKADMDIESKIKEIKRILDTTNDDRILEVWNESVDHDDSGDSNKVWDMCDLATIAETFCLKQAKAIISNLNNGRFDSRDKYFTICDGDYLVSCNSIWDYIDVDQLYDFVTKWYKIELYGRIWDDMMGMNYQNEELLLTMPNGDEIYSNNVEGYLALKIHNENRVLYSWI